MAKIKFDKVSLKKVFIACLLVIALVFSICFFKLSI